MASNNVPLARAPPLSRYVNLAIFDVHAGDRDLVRADLGAAAEARACAPRDDGGAAFAPGGSPPFATERLPRTSRARAARRRRRGCCAPGGSPPFATERDCRTPLVQRRTARARARSKTTTRALVRRRRRRAREDRLSRSRPQLRDVVAVAPRRRPPSPLPPPCGPEALVYTYCVIPRHELLTEVLPAMLPERGGGGVPADGVETRHIRSGEPIRLTREQVLHETKLDRSEL